MEGAAAASMVVEPEVGVSMAEAARAAAKSETAARVEEEAVVRARVEMVVVAEVTVALEEHAAAAPSCRTLRNFGSRGIGT